MLEQENINGQASPVPPTPPIPPTKQMMGGVQVATGFSISVFLQIFLIIFILLAGGGGLYMVINKKPPVNDSPIIDTNGAVGYGLNTETIPGQEFSFTCIDLLTATDIQKYSKNSTSVKITEGNDVKAQKSCSYIQEDEIGRVLDGFVVAIKIPYDKTAATPSFMYDFLKKYLSEISEEPLKDISGIGAKAFFGNMGPLDGLTVLSSNEKYVFSVSGWTAKNTETIPEVAKLIDINLNKY